MHSDCFVIGGGPAGLATAIAARMKGLTATVADPERPPIDKACGEGLMPDSLRALQRLGVTVDSEDGYPFHGIRFLHGNAHAEALFPTGHGVGIRRTALHEKLIERARECGVNLLWETRVTGIANNSIDMDGRTAQARFIIGADGEHSRVRAWAGLHHEARSSRRFGFRRHYAIQPWSQYMEVYWGRRCQIYVTPVSPTQICLAVISRDPRLRLSEALAEMPEVASRIENAEPAGAERGGVSATRALRRVSRHNIALVGDASGSVDAITGEGMCLAFHQATALADAMSRGTLDGYKAAHRRARFRTAMMSDTMLLMDRFAWARHRAIAAMSAKPAIFQQMVKMHVGECRPADFLRTAVLPLSWGLLRPQS